MLGPVVPALPPLSSGGAEGETWDLRTQPQPGPFFFFILGQGFAKPLERQEIKAGVDLQILSTISWGWAELQGLRTVTWEAG